MRGREDVGTSQLKITSSHRFVSPQSAEDQLKRAKYIAAVKSKVGNLSPATKRVLAALIKATFVSYSSLAGYSFQPANRAAIAEKLGRKTLVRYDVVMLRSLAAHYLAIEERKPLPRKVYGDIWLGAGMEFIYHVPLDTLVCLLFLDPTGNARLKSLREMEALESEFRVAKSADDFEYPEPSLFDRLIGRLKF